MKVMYSLQNNINLTIVLQIKIKLFETIINLSRSLFWTEIITSKSEKMIKEAESYQNLQYLVFVLITFDHQLN